MQQLYVAYDPSPPHLPIAVADTQKELAAILGIPTSTIAAYLHHLQRGRIGKKYGGEKYRAVCVDE